MKKTDHRAGVRIDVAAVQRVLAELTEAKNNPDPAVRHISDGMRTAIQWVMNSHKQGYKPIAYEAEYQAKRLHEALARNDAS